MRIRMLVTKRGSPNGVDIHTYAEGEVYTLDGKPPISEHLAKGWLASGAAEDPDAEPTQPDGGDQGGDDGKKTEGGAGDQAPDGDKGDQGGDTVNNQESLEQKVVNPTQTGDSKPNGEPVDVDQYHTGGGWYELPGLDRKVRKEEALEHLQGQ